jgi:dihydrofolate reductase
MLIYSLSVSVDGFIADRDGAFEWSVPDEELFRRNSQDLWIGVSRDLLITTL